MGDLRLDDVEVINGSETEEGEDENPAPLVILMFPSTEVLLRGDLGECTDSKVLKN